jgi:hypothetical protein
MSLKDFTHFGFEVQVFLMFVTSEGGVWKLLQGLLENTLFRYGRRKQLFDE